MRGLDEEWLDCVADGSQGYQEGKGLFRPIATGMLTVIVCTPRRYYIVGIRSIHPLRRSGHRNPNPAMVAGKGHVDLTQFACDALQDTLEGNSLFNLCIHLFHFFSSLSVLSDALK